MWCKIYVHLFLEGVVPALPACWSLPAGSRHLRSVPALESGPSRPVTSSWWGQINGQMGTQAEHWSRE